MPSGGPMRSRRMRLLSPKGRMAGWMAASTSGCIIISGPPMKTTVCRSGITPMPASPTAIRLLYQINGDLIPVSTGKAQVLAELRVLRASFYYAPL